MEFSQNVAKKMLTLQYYRHIPEINRRILPEDSWQRNNPHNAETWRNVGGNAIWQARLPAFALYKKAYTKFKWLAYILVETHQISNPGSGEGKNWLL